MIWFIVWAIGFIVIFFIPMILGVKMDEIDFAPFIVGSLLWPAVLFICIPCFLLVEGSSKLGNFIVQSYIKTANRMGKYWDNKRKFRAEDKK